MTAAAPDPELAPAPGLERWLSWHRGLVVAGLFALAAGIRLALCLQLAGGPLPRIHEIVLESDGAFFQRWGARIAAGDLLQRAPFHPTYGWMRTVADRALALDPALPERMGMPAEARTDHNALEERLWDGWMGGATFYQEPAYPYLVGLTYFLAGADAWHVYLWQLLLGVAGVLLVHRLARRLFSDTAALAAGLLALAAPVPLVYEVSLLRDGLVVFATLALALLMRWATGGGRGRWLILGLAFGAAALLKQSFLLFPIVLGCWRLATHRARLRAAAPAAGWVLAGMAAALIPVVARNLAVGVPPLAMNGSATAMLAVYHAASASPVDLRVGPEYADVLVASQGRLLASLIGAARTHPSFWAFAWLELGKLAYAWHPFEAPNNVDVYLFRQGAGVLRALPVTMVVVVPLTVIGRASPRAPEIGPILVAILASLPGLVLSAVLSRYRAPLVALLFPLAGAGVVRLAAWAASRRWAPIAVAAAASALYLSWASASPPGQSPAERARRYAFAGIRSLQMHEPAYAVLCLREAHRLQPADPRIRARLAQALFTNGDAATALREVEIAARAFDSSALRELHARILASTGHRDEATAEARAALAADPDNLSARELLQALGRAPVLPPATPERGTDP